jgi:serine protease AprX
MINTNTFNVSQSLRQANPGADLNQMADKVKDEEGLVQLIVSAKNGDEVSAAGDFVNLTGAKNVERLDIIDGFTADVTPEAFAKLVKNAPQGVTITFDEEVSVAPVELTRPEEMKEALADHPASSTSPELDVTVKTLGMDKIWEQGFKGQGVTIAVIDTGIAPHPDYNNRVTGFKDWVAGKTEHYDDQGHGTHVAGCAQGDGTMSAGKFMGAAPEANLVGIKVLDKRGSGRLSDIIKGVDWAVDHKDELSIDIINMSLGGPTFTNYANDPVAQSVGKAVDAGIIAMVAGGNSGPKPSTIGTPGNHPKAFTVGALNDRGTVSREDDQVAFFSSRGPTAHDGLTKPDILSPGVAITAANALGSALDAAPVPHLGQSYITISGTSMATPVMAGVVASILSANPDLSPAQVKEIFMGTADKLEGADANSQGSGVVDPAEALERALALKNGGQSAA